MNLIDAEIADDRIVFAGGDWLPIPDRFKNARNIERRVEFGLRPDDVYPTGHGLPSAAGSQLVERNLAVSVTEPLGNETLVFVAFGGHDWVTRMLNPAPLEPGRTIGVSFDLARAHLFSEDGRAMSATGG
jgi:multiple sugar transport system ATP-binding protein